MKLELELDTRSPGAQEAAQHLGGMQIFTSTFCPEHKIAVIIACEVDGGVEIGCTLAKLQDLARLLFAQANAQ